MAQIKISVNIPHLEKEYDVNVPDSATGEKLFEALLKTNPNLKNDDADVYELFSKRVGKKVFPDYRSTSLKEIGIEQGDTIIVKKDLDPGAR